MSSVSPIALSNTIGISGAAPTNGGIGNGDIAAPVPDSKRRRGRGLTWRPLAGAAAIVALSLPFAANDVSPSGFEARAIRTAAADATQTLRRQASALAQRGIATGQSQLLEEAVRAFEKSLEGPGVDNVTKAWTENQLALAQKHLATLTHDDALLQRAIAGYRRSLDYYTDSFDRQNAGIVAANLLSALLQIKNSDAGQVSAGELQALATRALAAVDRRTEPLLWARLQVQVGTLGFAIGARQGDPELVGNAIAALRDGLATAQKDGRPLREWAEDENLLANALEYLGQRNGSVGLLRQALQALENTWTLYRAAGVDQYEFYFDGRISALKSRLQAFGNPVADVRAEGGDAASVRSASASTSMQ